MLPAHPGGSTRSRRVLGGKTGPAKTRSLAAGAGVG